MKGIAGTYIIAALVIGVLLFTNQTFTKAVVDNGPTIVSSAPAPEKVDAAYNIMTSPIQTNLIVVVGIVLAVIIWL